MYRRPFFFLGMFKSYSVVDDVAWKADERGNLVWKGTSRQLRMWRLIAGSRVSGVGLGVNMS